MNLTSSEEFLGSKQQANYQRLKSQAWLQRSDLQGSVTSPWCSDLKAFLLQYLAWQSSINCMVYGNYTAHCSGLLPSLLFMLYSPLSLVTSSVELKNHQLFVCLFCSFQFSFLPNYRMLQYNIQYWSIIKQLSHTVVVDICNYFNSIVYL